VAAKEVIQLVQYFVLGWMLFVNVAGSRVKLRGLISVFLFAAGAVVLWGLIEYAVKRDVFTAGGAYGNINVLGAYLAIVLPFAVGIAVFDNLSTVQRMSIIVPALAGTAMILSLPALIAAVAGMLLVFAMRSGKLLVTGIAVLLLALAFVPPHLRENHAGVLAGSAGVYVESNHLLSDATALERAHKLMDEKRPADAWRLLKQIDAKNKLDAEGVKLLEQAEDGLSAAEKAQAVQVAARYKCWQASMRAIQARPWGAGVGWFKKTVGQYYGSIPKPNYDTDEPEAYNINSDQPDTFGQVFVTTVELGIAGLLALLWFYLWGLGQAVRLFASAQTPLSRAVGAGAAGSLAFLPILAAYSELLVRGVALPLIFIVCCVYILGKSNKELE